MSNDPMFAITMAASNLKIVAPEQFDKLVEAVKQLEIRFQRDFNAAGPADIFGAQGKVVVIADLRKRLEECLEKRKAYENRA